MGGRSGKGEASQFISLFILYTLTILASTGIYLTMEPTEKAVKQARSARQGREKEIKITEKSKGNNIKEIHQRRKTYLTETV